MDIGRARAADRRFTLRRLLKPLVIALVAGLVLDGLDALAALALPALVRDGIDHGVENKVFHAVLAVSLVGLAIVLADWLVNIAQTMVVGRTGERLLFTLRVKLFAQLQRLGLDFYERELSGRIMTRMTRLRTFTTPCRQAPKLIGTTISSPGRTRLKASSTPEVTTTATRATSKRSSVVSTLVSADRCRSQIVIPTEISRANPTLAP